ncbi:MAG: UDP-2,3-diacylglucosamine diphosphatase [Gammaproteobacteria bacterium]|nr:UDP-2,3-diacylglucosamine diphosphatase [Gammaproteobacteria bacterium]NND61282.1 UDP-2,3-diacylglucosamine diphosphatase [Gammaproteobacteria bacterium]
MTTLFIADLHLDEAQPEIGEQLSEFIAAEGLQAEALYILGDLFESWVGDDDPQAERSRVASLLNDLAARGIPVFIMRGNRDFLLSDRFARECGATLLDDEVVVELYGERVLLMHGDSLCTDDHEYQAFRTTVRDPAWQQQVLAQPLQARLALAQQARQRSRERNANAPEQIMDVNDEAVSAVMRKHGVQTLLHGHTHRPAVHEFELNGKPARRIVLGDWYDQGSTVTWDANGFELRFLPR